ncbi:MAG: MarR family winged helix-turn-helix transcriptional regulator [Tissierella sp.]|uniref:MarR family winged helix-turn-helix transcriptional regulator n=1 Tax=Tissierella sp. TaxID=41274 RepID=UPI003F96398E
MKVNELSNMLHRLRSIEYKLTQNFEDKTGFRLTRYQILSFVKENDGCNQEEIRKFIQIDRSAITRHLKVLEEKGYVTRERNKDNAREVVVSLSDFAKSELKKCHRKHNDNSCILPINISGDQINKLIELLDIIEKEI